MLPVSKIERHPICSLFDKLVNNENSTLLTRTKARLLMKRFVLDVHEVWLSNLQHLREHQPSRVIEDESQEQMESFNRGNGLDGRRDVRALESMHSQIPSCSDKRAMQGNACLSTYLYV